MLQAHDAEVRQQGEQASNVLWRDVVESQQFDQVQHPLYITMITIRPSSLS